jgi:hypothetical protein
VFLSVLTLFWQLLILFACCLCAGLALRFLIPKDSAPLQKALFSLVGGLFLVVLIPQNLVYLGVPVRISACFVLGAALLQAWICRHKLDAWRRTFSASGEVRTLATVILLTITFHGVVPIRQELEWYYGKGHFDQINYVLLAEFLKEEPYSTSQQDVGLRPWLVRNVGFQDPAEKIGTSAGPGQKLNGLKKERLGQSIITAEISAWSGTDGKGGYAATVIFFLTLTSICLYVFLRQTGIDRWMAASGAVMGALLPAVTRLSLNGFLSQASILFVFPFFGCLLQPQIFRARSFTLLFSLTLAYVAAAYSEIAPIGFCILILGVIFVRQDKFRTKRLIVMCAILIIALVNPYYLHNMIGFLGQQYYFAANVPSLDNLAPNILTLRGWSELVFGVSPTPSWTLFFDLSVILVGVLCLAGVILQSKRDRVILATILLPIGLVILFLATRNPPSYYPIAKITLTILPFLIGLVFVGLGRAKLRLSRSFTANIQIPFFAPVKNLLAALIVAAAVAGSARYYSEVLANGDLLRFVREPQLLKVCHQLEEIKNKRLLVFETHPLITAWLCYHARHNQVYFDGSLISDSPVPQVAAFTKIPDLTNIDYVVTRNQIVDLKATAVSCLTLIDDPRSEDRRDGHIRYWLGPPANVRFLALRPISANLNMRMAPGPNAGNSPVDYFLTDDQGHVSQGEIGDTNVVKRMNFPRGFSAMQLSVRDPPNADPSFPILAELDGVEVSDIDLSPGR